VIIRTPVDQGRARGNWIASVGSYGRAATIDKDKNGIKTVAQMGDKVLSTLAGGIVYMVNNVAYIKYLEYGRGDGKPGSSQAPRGMVRITLVEYQNYFNKAVREAKK
jgi:hypothetical protein